MHVFTNGKDFVLMCIACTELYIHCFKECQVWTVLMRSGVPLDVVSIALFSMWVRGMFMEAQHKWVV